MFLFYYRTTYGYDVPGVERHRTEAEVRREFDRATTPIVAVVPLTSSEVREAVRACLEAQLHSTPASETGLCWNLKNCLQGLK